MMNDALLRNGTMMNEDVGYKRRCERIKYKLVELDTRRRNIHLFKGESATRPL